MSNKQFISALGFYQYDNTLFDGLVVPGGIDKQLVIDQILMDTANLSLVYTDTNFMKHAISMWARQELPIWEKLYNAFKEDFNPLWNVDENTTETRTIQREDKGTSDRTTNSTSNETSAGTNESVESVKGFNNDNWAEHTKINGKNNDKTNGTLSGDEHGETKDTSNMTETFTRRRGGNIGVTKSTELLADYMAVIPTTNLIAIISKDFKKKFCIMVY